MSGPDADWAGDWQGDAPSVRAEAMARFSHTPGPWTVMIDDTGDRPIAVPSIQAAPEYDCAIVHWDGFWQEYWQSARGTKEMMANAHLIAASPDLLEAAEAVFGVSEASLLPKTILDALSGAIAKARGNG